jgi:hypothetical protein
VFYRVIQEPNSFIFMLLQVTIMCWMIGFGLAECILGLIVQFMVLMFLLEGFFYSVFDIVIAFMVMIEKKPSLKKLFCCGWLD